jgi:hypothetical protein
VPAISHDTGWQELHLLRAPSLKIYRYYISFTWDGQNEDQRIPGYGTGIASEKTLIFGI